MFAILLVIGTVAGIVRARDVADSQERDEMTRDTLVRMHRDLGESIALLRDSGFEITARDVHRWLRDLGTGGYLAGESTSMSIYRHDLDAGRFWVFAKGQWHNATTERTTSGEACGRLELTNAVENPLSLTGVRCPEHEVDTAWVPPCPVGGCAEDRDLLARTVLRVQRARWDVEPGAPVTLSPRPVPQRPVGDLRSDSTGLRCAPGTHDLGSHPAYVDGRRVPVRLCAIPGLPSTGAESSPGSGYALPGARGLAVVNVRVSGAAQALVETAHRAGIRLSANSSFRTMRRQRFLCQEDPGCRSGEYTLVAPPGYSQHQLGVAIDFAGTRVTATQSCEHRAQDPSSRVWRFLSRHAGRFGFRQYAAESWHWDALPGRARCGSGDS